MNGIKGVVIGHVLEREQHPNADKLSKCLVDIGGEEPVQIVCGAPNVAARTKGCSGNSRRCTSRKF